MKPNYNSKRSDFRANENHVKINQPLSQEYQDYAKIFWKRVLLIRQLRVWEIYHHINLEKYLIQSKKRLR